MPPMKEVDTVRVDTTGDGRVDATAFDTNGDGRFNAFDTNGDGQIDKIIVDVPEPEPEPEPDASDGGGGGGGGGGEQGHPTTRVIKTAHFVEGAAAGRAGHERNTYIEKRHLDERLSKYTNADAGGGVCDWRAHA